ncbi:hypothetical protein [Streptomyces canus]|uniref:hypothetical protein n=1 Tax=Streptomyces canus TaxID=58343 RepID=UPI0030E5AAC0
MKTAHVLVRHEARLFASLALWVVRRTHGTQGKEPFGYARGQGPMMFAFAFVCLIETLTMSVLLRDLPALHRIVLALDVYGIALVVALHAASVVRPHVLDGDSLRIRRAAQVDLRIPLSHIADVRRELRITHRPTDGELDLPVGSRTTVTLELSHPAVHYTFLGRRRDVHLVRFHADEAETLVHAITRARSALSALPDPPGSAGPVAAPPA